MHKFEKNEGSNSDPDMKPCCFPKMPDDETKGEKPGKSYVFQKLDCDINGRTNGTNKFNKNEFYEDTKEEANNLKDEAYAVGYRKGEREGLEAVRERFDPILCSLKEAVLSVEALNKSIRADAEEGSVRLAIALAEKIIHHEVHINREVVLDVVKEAIDKVVDHKQIKIRLSASDLMFIQELDPEFFSFREKFESVMFEEDPSITSGGCIVETGFGDIDARIEEQIQTIRESFETEIHKLRLED